MNERQTQFVKTLDRHLTQEISIREMDDWLNENIRPLFQTSVKTGKNIPYLWLEFNACRDIGYKIQHIEELFPKILPNKPLNLDWYWEKVISYYLDCLLGKKIYRTSGHSLEYPLGHKYRQHDRWLLPHLKYAEEIFQILTDAEIQNKSPRLPKPVTELEKQPLSSQSVTEMVMYEILDIIADYDELMDDWRMPKHYEGIDVKAMQLTRLEKLIKCFKGELYYSVSASFEGVDKFAISIVVA